MAQDSNCTLVWKTESVSDDATVAAIKLIHQNPIPVPPEVALLFLSPRKDGVTPREYGPIPLPPASELTRTTQRGRPKRAELHGSVRNSDLVPALKCQIELKLPKLPKPGAVVRFRAGDFTRQQIKAMESKLAADNVKDRNRTKKMLEKAALENTIIAGARHIRRLRSRLKEPSKN